MTAPAAFGRLARLYCWMEYFSFGSYLMQCRGLRLHEMADSRRALVYGDGDGRFLARLTRRAPRMQIVTVDASVGMLRRAASRLPTEAPVRMVHDNALTYQPEGPFDLVVSHFFLDCFQDDELSDLVCRVAEVTEAGTVWIVSDFAVPLRPIARTLGNAIIRCLYFAFRILTGLKTRQLPDHARVLRDAGWVLDDERRLLLGLLISQRWRRTDARGLGSVL